MSEHKGKGVKGRGYDELSGVGTSSAGITGTTGNLNTAGRDGGIGEPPPNDAGNLQHEDRGQSGDTPALGRVARSGLGNRQGAQGSGSASGTAGSEQSAGNEQAAGKPDQQGGSQSG